jgi:hypothetical protein
MKTFALVVPVLSYLFNETKKVRYSIFLTLPKLTGTKDGLGTTTFEDCIGQPIYRRYIELKQSYSTGESPKLECK